VSPEKVIDNEEDFRSHLFSLGASLDHAVSSKPPYKANSANLHEAGHVQLLLCVLGRHRPGLLATHHSHH